MNHAPILPADLPKFEGGRGPMLVAAAVGAIGLVLTALLGIANPQAALLGYLVAFVFFLFICLGSLAFVMANIVAGARWNIVLRRVNESLAAPAPLFLLLFIPLWLGAKHVWPWIDPGAHGFSKEALETLEKKRGYLSFGFFTVRQLIYFAVWTFYAWGLRSWSVKQDTDGAAIHTARSRTVSAPGLILLAFTMTFASFDWLMSLQPNWFSTIFGLYVFAGGFLGAMSLLAVVITRMRATGEPLGKLVTASHQHNVGKLMLAFTAFWAYMGFSQHMLIWAGNLPEEIPYIHVRSTGVWQPVGLLLIVGHFVIPFLLLLSRDLKRRPALAALGVWILAMCYVDVYYIVMPALHPTDLGFSLAHVTAFLGIGGVTMAAQIWFLRAGGYPLPVRDPYLEDSLRYVQP